jgi:trimeric autotransporter adhesin
MADAESFLFFSVSFKNQMTYVSALIAQADLRKLRGSTIERKQMSTKTIYKRIALVAVASLGAGLLSVAPANAANSAGTATVAPVRVSFIGTTQDAVDPALVTFTADADWTDADVAGSTNSTLTVAVTTAPGAAAELTLSAGGGVFETVTTAVAKLGTNGVLTDTDDSLDAAADTLTGFALKANTAGTYSGTITVDPGSPTAAGTDNLVIPFTFTTRGAVASFDFVPTTAGVISSAASGTISTTVTLRDAANNITQGSTVDTFKLTAAISAGGTVGTFASSGDITAANLVDGTQALVYTNSVTAGSTSTLTATPQGTLGTLTAKTLTVTAVAANTGVPTATIAVSNTTIKAATSTAVLNKYTVSVNQTTVTFNVTGLTPNTSVAYTVGSSTTNTVSVNGGTAGDINTSVGSFTSVSTATGTLAITAKATTPATQTITLDLNGGTADVTGQVNADFTYATGAFAATVTTPAATPLFRTGSAITYTGKVADQFGNPLAGATVTATGTPTPATTPSTITATAVTAADGTYTVTLPAVAATTTSLSTVVSATGTASVSSAAANVAYFTATGIAATLVLTDTDSGTGTSTTDNKSSRTIPKARTGTANDGIDDLIDAHAATTDNVVSITPQTTLPDSVGYSVTATNGIRLFTSDQNGALGLANTAAITGTGGTAFFAIPTKAGAGVITVVSGGLTQTFTLTGLVAAAPRANLVTLTAGTIAGSYTVTATDAFGNGVAADVAISVAGPGAFGNGFKNLTVTTAAATGQNTFSIVSDGSAPTVVTASIAGATNYTAIVAADVTTYGLLAISAAATSTLAGKGADATGTSLAALTTLINSLIAKINALNKLVIKIQKKVRA